MWWCRDRPSGIKSSRQAIITGLISISLAVLAAPSGIRAQLCLGDCNNDGQVTVDELVRGVNIALETEGTAPCAAIDRDGNGGVTIDELIAAIAVALSVCEGPAPTPTLSATPTESFAETSPSPTPSATPKPWIEPTLPPRNPARWPPPPLGIAYGDSLRILTFNTYLLSPFLLCWPDPVCGFFEDLAPTIRKRGRQIARELSYGYFDVVALNEVWDEDDGKDLLLHDLLLTYPYWVRYVDASEFSVEEDSGLMLFSRWPLSSLQKNTYVSKDNETSYGDDSDRVAYKKFDEATLPDSKAAKGAVLVRPQQPGTGRIANVVLTHLNADYPEDDEYNWDVRESQFGDIYELIAGSLDDDPFSGWDNDDWLLVLGDFNIRGLGAVGTALYPSSAPTMGPTTNGRLEWWDALGRRPAERSIWPLYDAWAETTSEADPGATRDDEEGRLDYVLMSRGTGGDPSRPPACVQHVWIPPTLERISDHKAVAADINRFNTHCNPRLALPVSPPDSGAFSAVGKKQTSELPGESIGPEGLPIPGGWLPMGGMQWFRVDDPGTWVVALDPVAQGTGVTVDVYQAKDLSDPLGGDLKAETDVIQSCELHNGEYRNCHNVSGQKFVLPSPPYYVRAYSTNRQWQGAYGISFYRYQCRSAGEACDLLPNAPTRFTFPCSPICAPLNPEDTAWFRARIAHQADIPLPQKVEFYAKADAAAQRPKVELFASDASTRLTSLDQPVNGPLFALTPAADQDGRVSIKGNTPFNQSLFVLVRRPDASQPLTIDAGWNTNLVLAGGIELGKHATVICHDETNGIFGNEWGEDEIRLDVKVDDFPLYMSKGRHSFNCNSQSDLAHWDDKLGVIKFLDTLHVRLAEEDDLSADDTNTKSFTMEFDVDLTRAERSRAVTFEFNDGRYELLFNLGKWLEAE